jgi:large-conductance mechanosensitive channel
MTFDLFVNAYSVTSLVMFPILAFIVVLLIKDLGKYSKLSEKINNVLKNLSEDIEDKGFKKDKQESLLSHISRFINK